MDTIICEIFEPGIYDISNDQYHASEGISRSALWEFKQLPHKYWYKYLSGKYIQKPTSDAMNIGKLVHTLTLEPWKFGEEYFVMPKIDRRTKIGKNTYDDIISSSIGKAVISQENYDLALSMTASISSNPMVSETLMCSKIEKSIYWKDDETGLICKARPDIWRGAIAADLKTTANASPKVFQHEAMKYGYYLQAAMIYEACQSLQMPFESFVFLCVEKEEPYSTAIYALDDNALQYGIDLFHSLLRKLKQCKDSNDWPDYGINTLFAPQYALLETLED